MTMIELGVILGLLGAFGFFLLIFISDRNL